jgi:spore coat polysaccharide biosynthesis predicted glycosyltransferase SpsG
VTSLTLVHDFGVGCGLGHRSRMRSLQSALAARGLAANLVEATLTGPPTTDDVLVVDSYLTRADDSARYQARIVVAVDDLQRDLKVDLLVDPNPGGTTAGSRAGRLLSGPEFALISPLDHPSTDPPNGTRRRVLVTTGGGDTATTGLRIAADLAALRADVDVRVVVGAAPPIGETAGVTLLHGLPSLGPELLVSDVVVTAGGVTLLESLHAGRPTVVVVLAENQRRAVEGAVAAGAALLTTPDKAASAAATLLDDAPRRAQLRDQASGYIDGRGAERVAEAIIDLL